MTKQSLLEELEILVERAKANLDGDEFETVLESFEEFIKDEIDELDNGSFDDDIDI